MSPKVTTVFMFFSYTLKSFIVIWSTIWILNSQLFNTKSTENVFYNPQDFTKHPGSQRPWKNKTEKPFSLQDDEKTDANCDPEQGSCNMFKLRGAHPLIFTNLSMILFILGMFSKNWWVHFKSSSKMDGCNYTPCIHLTATLLKILKA